MTLGKISPFLRSSACCSPSPGLLWQQPLVSHRHGRLGPQRRRHIEFLNQRRSLKFPVDRLFPAQSVASSDCGGLLVFVSVSVVIYPLSSGVIVAREDFKALIILKRFLKGSPGVSLPSCDGPAVNSIHRHSRDDASGLNRMGSLQSNSSVVVDDPLVQISEGLSMLQSFELHLRQGSVAMD